MSIKHTPPDPDLRDADEDDAKAKDAKDAVVTPQLVTDAGAISISPTIQGARRIFNLDDGLKIAHLEITLANAAAAMPTSGQLLLPPAIVQRMGFYRIIGIPEILVMNSVGAMLMGQHQYDPVLGGIRILDNAGGAIAPATIGNGGKIRLLTFGI